MLEEGAQEFAANRPGTTDMKGWQYNDGGREAAGYKGTTRDCVVRAIAIATERPYREVYEAMNELSKRERIGTRKRGRSNARTGVYKYTLQRYMESIGWQWTPTMKIGQGCKVHLRTEELPLGLVGGQRKQALGSRHRRSCPRHL